MKFLTPDARFGATRESLLDRRARAAQHEGQLFGRYALSAELAAGLARRITPGMRVLEVDAGPGHITRLLHRFGATVTALEPAPAFAAQLREIAAGANVERPDSVRVVEGFTEDLPAGAPYDAALVSFPARRGIGLLALLNEVAPLVTDRIFFVLPDDGSLDWAYLTRACAIEGFIASARFYVESDKPAVADMKRAVVLSIERTAHTRDLCLEGAWDLEARTIHVPYPVPRGAATRLVRYFVAGGDRAVLITTEPLGLNRLYGNLRTAAHRIARDEVTVRRVDDGIQLMLIPKTDA